MVISELIQRMEDIKARYGDCRVFIMSKSFYEGGTILDAQNILLTSFNTDKKSTEKEVIAMISNCPVVGAVPGTEEDAERILKGPAINNEHTSEDKLPPIVFQPSDFILHYLRITSKYYVDYSDISNFADFIKTAYLEGEFENYHNIVIDLDHNSFLRVSDILKNAFDRSEDRLYIRSDEAFNDLIESACTDEVVEGWILKFLVNQVEMREDAENDDT